jgi:hypothetical protein
MAALLPHRDFSSWVVQVKEVTQAPDWSAAVMRGQFSAGDFVVVSGRILYAEASDNKPLPNYAVYQAGSHCSATQGSKQEDVFVTEITYLAHLR